MSLRLVLLGSACVFAALSAVHADEAASPSKRTQAEEQGGGETVDQKEKVTVTATRQKRRTDEVPGTVTVITDEEIEKNLATDVKDLVRYEPGVSVRTQPSRFTAAGASTGRDGNSGFNIRGLEGNRVLVQVDGIRVPDGFSFGPQAVGRGDYVDIDLLKSVEILRGPASALYGSDGVAGAVSFMTKDPEDLIADGETFGGRARVSYGSADNSWSESLVGATQTVDGKWQGLLAYTRRDANETENAGENEALDTTRTTANPQEIESNGVLAKLLFVPTPSDKFRLTYEYSDRNIVTEVFSARAVAPPPAASSVIDLDTDDTLTRNRVSLDHRHEGGEIFTSVFWAIYYQSAETREFSREDRFTALDRTRDSTFDNEVWGLTFQFENTFNIGGIVNNLVYGGDYSETSSQGIRAGETPPFGESFPTKPFPDTVFTLGGAFIQDEIVLADGKLKLYPALRYDTFEIDPTLDSLYHLGIIAPQEDSHLTPKFGAVYWPVNQFGLFFNYANGFKAPAPSQVNNGFTNSGAFYTSIPNPNLKPETSQTFEGGVRVRDIAVAGGDLRGSVTAFTGKYEDFIDQLQVAGNFTPATPAVFQYVNLNEVEISGAEARIDVEWPWGLGFTIAAATTEGTVVNAGVETPLPSIDPLKLVTGVRYTDPEGRFGTQLILTHSAGKDASDVAPATACPPSAACVLNDDFTILDFTAFWNVTDHVAIRAGVFNITDEKYSWWSDVRGLGAPTTVADAYTQPGRNASVSLSYRY